MKKKKKKREDGGGERRRVEIERGEDDGERERRR